jgi:CBS domain-containing protein
VIEVPVAEVMSAPVHTVEPSASTRRAAELLVEYEVGSLVVVEDDRPVGIVTESDLVGLVAADRDPDAVAVESVTTAPVVTVDTTATVREVAGEMREHGIRRVPVVDGGLAGIVTAADLAHYVPKLRERIGG